MLKENTCTSTNIVLKWNAVSVVRDALNVKDQLSTIVPLVMKINTGLKDNASIASMEQVTSMLKIRSAEKDVEKAIYYQIKSHAMMVIYMIVMAVAVIVK